MPRWWASSWAMLAEEIFDHSTRVYDNLSQEFPFLARRDRTPKKMFFSRLFSAMNFTGFHRLGIDAALHLEAVGVIVHPPGHAVEAVGSQKSW